VEEERKSRIRVLKEQTFLKICKVLKLKRRITKLTCKNKKTDKIRCSYQFRLSESEGFVRSEALG
jgi:hypothetical protein